MRHGVWDGVWGGMGYGVWWGMGWYGVGGMKTTRPARCVRHYVLPVSGAEESWRDWLQVISAAATGVEGQLSMWCGWARDRHFLQVGGLHARRGKCG